MRILFTQETDWIKRNPAQQHHLAEMLSLKGHDILICAIAVVHGSRHRDSYYLHALHGLLIGQVRLLHLYGI